MKDIFAREEKVCQLAEQQLKQDSFSSAEDAGFYRALLEEYKVLLKQMMRVVKLSDIMQLELKTVSEKLEQVSRIDVLTGLYNKRYFNEAYLREWKSAVRNKTSLSVIMMDIDYFKKFNDTYGHLQGDECLKSIGAVIKGSVQRPRDIAARFGGEEFVVLLPETGSEGADFLARQIRANIEGLGIIHEGSPVHGKITVSVGAASILPHEETDMDILLRQADHALYKSKHEGRNCVWLY